MGSLGLTLISLEDSGMKNYFGDLMVRVGLANLCISQIEGLL